MYMRKYNKQKKMEDASCKFVNSWRVVCDGMVVYEIPGRLGDDFAKRMCGHFISHIRSALSEPGWTFKGCGGEMTAEEWLEFHEENLGMPLSLNVVLISPGVDLPLCPALEMVSLGVWFDRIKRRNLN